MPVGIAAGSRGPIYLVYGFYVHPGSNWRAVMAGQIADLRRFGLLDRAALSIVITDPHNTAGVADFAAGLCEAPATIIVHDENRYEYWALHHLWTLACAHPDGRVAYLHSKGISRNIRVRSRVERALTRGTFEHWERWLMLMERDGIALAGMFPASGGWVWYNFWWATASYLASLPEPEVTADRYAYESWVGRGACGAAREGLSTFSGCVRAYSAGEADSQMHQMTHWSVSQHPWFRRLIEAVR
ncbi:hypothetical protein AncyloWKF20_13120 [Ancylobacter sp. WKF20]|uniref:hypothetical protein n=1 Tax=Ancylobacter sp. WKF20 TaxID=3039801 RepID=UPI0024341504|nr:hypothetical protein [Ancylobacter sp. WKF20]WGD28739.1 hypothetical protein AncyloWKF20_13120 [Ancylobacter sp. WKF20]